MTLSEQFIQKIQSINLGDVASSGLEKYKEVMRDSVSQGKAPFNGANSSDWNNDYSPKQAKKRTKRGRQTSFVDLNMGQERYYKDFMKQSQLPNSATFGYSGGEISQIMEAHMSGDYGHGALKPRPVMPNDGVYDGSVLPQEVLDEVKRALLEALQ